VRTSIGVAVAWCALVLAGCGGGEEAGTAQKADPAPFEAALVEYLRVGSMDMKPEKFESLQVTGDTAVAKVRMATKDGLYGLKPTWSVTFAKTEKGWQVLSVKR